MHSLLFELCDPGILLFCMNSADWMTGRPSYLAACVHYITGKAGSAGWLVDWIMIEHTACQPPLLPNWLTNWLPAWLNDDQTHSWHLFRPFLIKPTTQWPAWHQRMLPSWFKKKKKNTPNGQMTQQSGLRVTSLAGHSLPVALRSLLSKKSISYND